MQECQKPPKPALNQGGSPPSRTVFSVPNSDIPAEKVVIYLCRNVRKWLIIKDGLRIVALLRCLIPQRYSPFCTSRVHNARTGAHHSAQHCSRMSERGPRSLGSSITDINPHFPHPGNTSLINNDRMDDGRDHYAHHTLTIGDL